MKHAAFIILVAVALYSVWYAVPRSERKEAIAFLKTHGLRAVFIVVVLLSALALAYQDIFPAIHLLK